MDFTCNIINHQKSGPVNVKDWWWVSRCDLLVVSSRWLRLIIRPYQGGLVSHLQSAQAQEPNTSSSVRLRISLRVSQY